MIGMSKTAQAVCPYCGAADTIEHHTRKVKGKKDKTTFGVGWLLATILTGGLALILFFIVKAGDRVGRKPTVGVDRWNECSACHTRW